MMTISLIAAISLCWTVLSDNVNVTVNLFMWFKINHMRAYWGLKIDSLSAIMTLVVTFISFLVHVYSLGYMKHDTSLARFMAYLSFFTFTMLILVTAPNLLQMFAGWEGVGLASYLLIGFWYERPNASNAAMKAFIVNRVGDVGFILGICTVFSIFHTFDFDAIFTEIPKILQSSKLHSSFLGWSFDSFNLIAFLFFIGAMGKSAQIGLHVWLPDAMEGPTPVSALIHAATMVTAGVFMVVRLSPIYELAPFARECMCVIGGVTAIFAATVALTQTDIKRVIAYSTCSQLGYMMFACGCSAYSAAFFHLVTHAFFKALLFLGAGSVIHAMSDEQNMEKMGGIYRLIPFTYVMMWIGTLALAGVPFFAGYFSKDAIIEAAYASGTVSGFFAFMCGLIVAALTALYSLRLLILVFHGEPKADDQVMAHVHEIPWVMRLPLLFLSFGSIFSGLVGSHWFLKQEWGFSWDKSIITTTLQEVPTWVEYIPFMYSLSGIVLAYLFYIHYPHTPQLMIDKFAPVYRFFLNKWYIDDLYQKVFVRAPLALGGILWRFADRQIIDRLGPDGITALTLKTSRIFSRFQTGYIYHYAFAMLLGVFGLVTIYFIILYIPPGIGIMKNS
jgi:NADH-quinone oxidoreductase subunit L